MKRITDLADRDDSAPLSMSESGRSFVNSIDAFNLLSLEQAMKKRLLKNMKSRNRMVSLLSRI